MDFLYSLYDALVSINVPSDKARAVVDAMERDMGTILATKQDLEILTLATKQDLAMLRQEISGVQRELKQDITGVQRELKQDIENRFTLLTHEIGTQTLRMTIRLGSMLFLGLGLTIAVLRLWSG